MIYTLDNISTLSAIIPTYTTTGDCSILYFANNTESLQNIRIKAVLNRLIKDYAFDLKTIKRVSRQNTNSYLLTPLPLAPNLILMPIKIRTPRIRGDTSLGYINAAQNITILAGRLKDHNSLIVLPSGVYLDCLWQVNTLLRRLQIAKSLAMYTPYFSNTYFAENNHSPELLSIAHKFAVAFYEITAAKNVFNDH